MTNEQSLAEKLSLFECIQCGKCTAGCPVSLKSKLNIRRLVWESVVREGPLPILDKNELWDCITCAICAIRCPRGLKPDDLIINLRGLLVEEGRVPTTIGEVLESVFKYANPWGRIKSKRTEWTEGLEIRNLSSDGQSEILYFVGCTPAYDPRVQQVATALVKCLSKAKVDFGILGNEEKCCGNEIRRMGEQGLFEMLVEDNTALFQKYGINQIMTTSPHCYHVFKNEYSGTDFETQHYTQFVADLIEEGRLTFTKKVEKVVTYQDPCFLGKQNGIFDEPRKIINSIPGISFVEFDRTRERSLCCEGGGGRMWVEASQEGERLAEIRVKEAIDIGAEIIATACPFCLLTLEDAVKTTGNEEKIQVMDIIELAQQAI